MGTLFYYAISAVQVLYDDTRVSQVRKYYVHKMKKENTITEKAGYTPRIQSQYTYGKQCGGMSVGFLYIIPNLR